MNELAPDPRKKPDRKDKQPAVFSLEELEKSELVMFAPQVTYDLALAKLQQMGALTDQWVDLATKRNVITKLIRRFPGCHTLKICFLGGYLKDSQKQEMSLAGWCLVEVVTRTDGGNVRQLMLCHAARLGAVESTRRRPSK